MGLLTLTLILFTQVIVISAAGVANQNGTYEYDNIQFVCNNSTFSITSILQPTAAPSSNTSQSECTCRVCATTLTAWPRALTPVDVAGPGIPR